MIQRIIFAGFGGQGVLFAGKTVAYAGMDKSLEISWLPSYGPEMRGGTANCSVTVSDMPIGSPIITRPDVLIAMNKPSLEKFMNTVEPGGVIVYDSSLIDTKITRDDVTIAAIPAKKLADDAGSPTLANMVLLGGYVKNNDVLSIDDLAESIKAHIPPKRMELAEKNIELIRMGFDYEG